VIRKTGFLRGFQGINPGRITPCYVFQIGARDFRLDTDAQTIESDRYETVKIHTDWEPES